MSSIRRVGQERTAVLEGIAVVVFFCLFFLLSLVFVCFVFVFVYFQLFIPSSVFPCRFFLTDLLYIYIYTYYSLFSFDRHGGLVVKASAS